MPDRALRPILDMIVASVFLIVRKPPMPDRALRHNCLWAKLVPWFVRKPPMPDRALRQSIYSVWALKYPDGQKTPNARQGITTYRWLDRHSTMRSVRKPPMPDRALRLTGEQCGRSPVGSVRKPPMPDRALRLNCSERTHAGVLESENPQCPTGHYDFRSLFLPVRRLIVRKPPMPDRALRLAAMAPPWRLRASTSENPQCPTGHYDQAAAPPPRVGRKSENPQCPTGHYDPTSQRALRSTTHTSENPQCPTGHYDGKVPAIPLPHLGRQKTPNARQGITTDKIVEMV